MIEIMKEEDMSITENENPAVKKTRELFENVKNGKNIVDSEWDFNGTSYLVADNDDHYIIRHYEEGESEFILSHKVNIIKKTETVNDYTSGSFHIGDNADLDDYTKIKGLIFIDRVNYHEYSEDDNIHDTNVYAKDKSYGTITIDTDDGFIDIIIVAKKNHDNDMLLLIDNGEVHCSDGMTLYHHKTSKNEDNKTTTIEVEELEQDDSFPNVGITLRNPETVQIFDR